MVHLSLLDMSWWKQQPRRHAPRWLSITSFPTRGGFPLQRSVYLMSRQRLRSLSSRLGIRKGLYYNSMGWRKKSVMTRYPCSGRCPFSRSAGDKGRAVPWKKLLLKGLHHKFCPAVFPWSHDRTIELLGKKICNVLKIVLVLIRFFLNQLSLIVTLFFYRLRSIIKQVISARWDVLRDDLIVR